MRVPKLLRTFLGLFLTGLLLLPQGVRGTDPLFLSSTPAKSYLAPHSFTDSPESVHAAVRAALQMKLRYKTDALIAGACERAAEREIEVRFVKLKNGEVEVKDQELVVFESKSEKIAFLVSASGERDRELSPKEMKWLNRYEKSGSFPASLLGIKEVAEGANETVTLAVFPVNVVVVDAASLGKTVGKRILEGIEEASPSPAIPAKPRVFSRSRLAAAALLAFALALFAPGCGEVLDLSSKGKNSSFSTVAGEPRILGQGKNFNTIPESKLKDDGRSDTTEVLRVKVENAVGGILPTHFSVTGKTAKGEEVILNPFDPNPDNYTVKTFKIADLSQEQDIFPRAFEVKEAGGNRRPVKAGDEITFEVRVLKENGNNPIRNAVRKQSAALTIAEEKSILQHAGQPEAGELVGAVQDPAGLSIFDGTVRVKFKTNIAESDSVKPGFVYVAVFDDSGKTLLKEFSVPLVNPTSVNEFDLPLRESDQDKLVFADNTRIKIEASNADFGLTPPAVKGQLPSTVKVSGLVSRRGPKLVRDAKTNDLVSIVRGTRLVKLRIDPDLTNPTDPPKSDPIKPEFHFVKLTVFDAMTQRETAFTTTLTLPTVLVNGKVEPVVGQANEYLVEIPAENFSQGGLSGSSLQSIEVFSVRRGYASVSSGKISLKSEPNNVFTDADTVKSTPQLNGQVSVKEATVTLAIDPKATPIPGLSGPDPTTAHIGRFHLTHPAGDAIDVPIFVLLPTVLDAQGKLVVDVNSPHTFQIKITDPSAVEFLKAGQANLVSVTLANFSDQFPKGAEATYPAGNLPVSLAATPVAVVPQINGAQSLVGDTAVSVNLKVAGSGSGGSVPMVLSFNFTLKNSQGTRFTLPQTRALSAVHQKDLTASDTYVITLEDPRIDKGTVVESVTVVDQDANLNESAPNTFTPSSAITLDPGKVSKAPTNVNVSPKQGNPEVAVITFAIPTQDLSGNALPGGLPDAIVDAVTASGKQYTLFFSKASSEVTLFSQGVGQVLFDFKRFGVPNHSESVQFFVRTAPVSQAVSARSAPASANILVAGLVGGDNNDSSFAAARWNRKAFSGAPSRNDGNAPLAAMAIIGLLSLSQIRKITKKLQEGKSLKTILEEDSSLIEKNLSPEQLREVLPELLRLDLQNPSDASGAAPYVPRFTYPPVMLESAV